MKSLFIFHFSIITSFSAFSTNDAAIAYNDKIIGEQVKIGEAILAFSSNPNEFSLEQIKTQADKGVAELSKLEAFEGNKNFLDAAKALFKFYSSITNAEYKKLLILLNDKDKYNQTEFIGKVNKLSTSISNKEAPLDAKFQSAQKEFAKKYGFSLSENELDEKIKELKEDE